eukprot:TRINITY_DN1134_c0_g1_i1.p1 TRINITY_DN1134_c0_g1~~TRINITY_DN1134_c0_g1_i1.p1  ORF type:complete len:336 (+),score=97.10 TRINITY_DN1134_c0_g1_i1:107-1114(+)
MDSNLSKDRFLRRICEEDAEHYVDLDVLCSFNILKKMDVKPMEICEAVENVSEVSLSDDRKRIRPSGPLPPVFHNADGRTVYVETFPSNTKHEDVENIFTSCGRVVYVSLPRFKESQSIKGFAFVEFENEISAERAAVVKNRCLETINGVDVVLHVLRKKEWARLREQYLHIQEELIHHGKICESKRSLLQLREIAPSISRGMIRETFHGIAQVKYVDMHDGMRVVIRFATMDGAHLALQRVEDGALADVIGKSVEAKILNAKECEEYWLRNFELHEAKDHEESREVHVIDEPTPSVFELSTGSHIRFREDGDEDEDDLDAKPLEPLHKRPKNDQ